MVISSVELPNGQYFVSGFDGLWNRPLGPIYPLSELIYTDVMHAAHAIVAARKCGVEIDLQELVPANHRVLNDLITELQGAHE